MAKSSSKNIVSIDRQSVQTVLSGALSQNDISSQSHDILCEKLDDIALAGCQGIAVEDLDLSQVVVDINLQFFLLPL